jgi:dTDP-4-dehydrorhamnose reductase
VSQAVTGSFTRTLLIGASGQLGLALAARFSTGTLIAASHRHLQAGDWPIDLGDAFATTAALAAARPDVILLAGAMCNVDLCETESETCERINTIGPSIVADYARTHDAHVVFFSTDHVFDGDKASYIETDAVNPLNVYARSKVRAEETLRERLPDRHLIIRTGWVYGPDWQRRNFVLRLIDRLGRGERVSVPRDQWGSPTYTDDIAAATRYLVDRGVTGTFHATGPDLIDRASLAAMICQRFGLEGRLVVAQTTPELAQSARRPLRVQLDCRKLQNVGAPAFRGVAAGLVALAAWSELRETGAAS